ncbi:MAG: hypothetical protein ACJA2W_001377 [Planctomycetota bacterium]|jgi:hypothetical protein
MSDATTAAAGATIPPANDEPGLLSRIGDYLNPVLVKEIRQAQRGRVFTVALVATVLITLMASILMALEIDASWGRPGRQFFTMIYVFLAGSLMLVVPFQAFSSMGSEWDEHTYEMLVLSNLKPSQIVLGKLLAAATQGAMLLALFMPFIAVAFLLRGVDLFVLGLVLVLTAFTSLWLSTFAIMLSALTRNRLLRVLLMVMLGGGLIGVISGAVTLAGQSIRRPDQIVGPEFWIFMPQVLAVFALLGGLAFLISCNLLAHEEENRSTNIRVLVTLATVAFLVMVGVDVSVAAAGIPREVVFVVTVAAVFMLTLFAVFFCSEPEKLGRRVVRSVPKNRMTALLTLPWYPGGGRGVIYFLVHLGLLVGGGFVMALVADRSSYLSGTVGADYSIMGEGGMGLLISVLYAVLYSIVPIGFLGLFLRSTRINRRIMRAIAIFSPFLYITVPAIIGLIVDDRALQDMKHVGNPGFVIERYFGAFGRGPMGLQGPLVLLVVVALVATLLTLPKMVRAVRETLAARRLGAAAAVATSASVDNPVEIPVEIP